MLLALAHLVSFTSSCGDPAVATDPTPLVVRGYDVCAANGESATPRKGERFFPNVLTPLSPTSADMWAEPFAWEPDAARLAAIVQDVFAEEFQSAGRQLWDDGNGRLFARAPETVQRGIQELLASFELAWARPTEITVDILRQPAGAAPIASSLVPLADADRLLASGGGTRSSYALRIPAGNIGSINASTMQDTLIDYDVEIAQGSVQFDPIVATLESGLRLEAASAPAPGGVWLALVVRDLAPVGNTRELALDASGTLTTERGAVPVASPALLQGACTEVRALGLNTLLPEGKALLIQTTLGTRDAQGSTLVCLRLAGKAPPKQFEIGTGPAAGDRRGTLVNLQFSAPPVCRLVCQSNNDAPELEVLRSLAWRRTADEQLALFSVLTQPPMNIVEEMLPENLVRETFGPWIYVHPDPSMQPSADYATEDLETILSRAAPSTRLFQLRLSLSRKGGPVLARAALPMRVGEASSVMLGTESSYVADYDTEVAQNASLLDPMMAIAFEGFVVRAIPRAGVHGDLTLELTVIASSRREPPRAFDPRAGNVGKLTQETMEQLVAHERIGFSKDSGAARSVTLGDGVGSGLSLIVELDEVR